MTYSDCWIEELEPDKPRQRTPSGADLPCITLSREPGSYRIADVKTWAKQYGLEIEYIDNCWIEVECSADQLKDFLAQRYKPGHPAREETIAKINDTRRYVVVAEEF